MPNICTKSTTRNSGHDNCPPTGIASTSQSILKIHGSPAVVVGDTCGGHSCGSPFDHPYHVPVVAQGSSILRVNGVPVAYVGCMCSGCPLPNSLVSGDPLVNVKG